jgi:hypothetical protein
VLYALVAVCSLGLTVYTILRDPRVQTLGVRITAAFFSREWKTDVRVGEFDFSLTGGVVFRDVMVKDRHDTVLFSTRELAVQPDFRQLWNGYLHIHKVLVDGGEFRLLTHKGDSALNLQFIIDYFASTDTTTTPSDTISKPFTISGAMAEIRDFRFNYRDFNAEPVAWGMDYANIDVKDINLKLTAFSVRGDTISANITTLRAKERSGFELLAFSGEASVCSHFVKVRNLKVQTPRSDLDLDYAMLYDGYAGFLDFLNKVTIKADIRPSTLNLADIGYFAPELKVMDDLMKIEGEVLGTVSRFRADNLRFASGEETLFYGDLMAVGLPDIYKTYVDLDIREFTSSRRDIGSFKVPSEPDSIALPAALSALGRFTVRGRFTGFWDDFVASSQVATALGRVTSNLVMKREMPSGIFSYDGQVMATSLNAGALLGYQAMLGRVTFSGSVNGHGLSLNEADLTMNLSVDSLMLNGYNYQKIAVNGTLDNRQYDGSLSFRDPNIWLDFSGRADFHDSIPTFDFNAWIHHAQLFRLNLLDRDSVENISGQVVARFSGNSIDNIEGLVRLDEMAYIEGRDTVHLSKFLLKTSKDTRGNKSFHLESDFLDADITGVFSFQHLIGSADIFIRNYIASFTLNDSLIVRNEAPPQLMRYILEFKETKEVTDIFLPFLQVSPGTTLNGYFDTEQNIFRMEGSSPLVSVYGLDLTNLSVDAESNPTELRLTTGCDRLYISRSKSSDTLDILIDSLDVTALMRRDSVHYDIGWTSLYGPSILNGVATFPAEGATHIRQEQFSVMIKGNRWKIAPDNLVVIDSSGYEFRNLVFTSSNQGLSVKGRISDNPNDTLSLGFKRVNISDADYFLENKNINIDGILNGTVKLRDVFHNFAFSSDLKVEDLRFNGEPLGDALIAVNYDMSNKRFDINSQIIYTGNIGQNIPLSIAGNYQLGDKPGFDFDIKLKNLNLKMVQPFVSDVMSKLTGLVSGEAHLTGTTEKPELTGQLKLMRTELTVAYLNVPYSISDQVDIELNKFVFNNLTLYDSLGNKAYLNGDISHKYFKDFNLNLNISMDDFSAFRNSVAQNSTFYGHARASGNVRITGPVENISFEIRANTGSSTSVVIPINLTADVGQLNYIIFEDKTADTVLIASSSGNQASPSGISLLINLAVRSDANVEVILPDQLGNLKTSGTGNLTMAMTPTTPFTINGSYVISKGYFLLQLRNLLRLPFNISPGSRIAWTGDPADADISLSALYRTKVPLAGLTTDPEAASTRVMVECILRLKGKLLNPVYEFGLNMPNAEESAKNLVYSTIDTNNQVEMSQQVLSILMLNQFQPVVGTAPGVDVSGTSISLVTNQINSMISRMTNNVNVNVNYQPGTTSTGQEFDVGLSTQFLDDRLLIDGAFGMTSYKNASSQQTNTIVGDINIEYVLTKNRRWRVRAFNRTNTLDLLYNNAPYTQGVGMSYQRDFNSVRELFKGDKSEKGKGKSEEVKSKK